MQTIAIFSGYYLPHLGGVERYTYNLALKLKKMGYKIIIITSRYNKDLKEIEETDYAKIVRLPTYKKLNRSEILSNLFNSFFFRDSPSSTLSTLSK